MGPTLRELSLRNVSNVGDEGLFEIAHRCHMLKKLDLFQLLMNRVNILLSYVGDEGLFDISHGCHLLERLDLFQWLINRGMFLFH
ncbi:hypothetical protein MTR67_001040 [Solanum verrucosum]|uniref:Uncharacterized protein n=1 Tax=Solanum verrucosum TaxID=315347 RepID=A0AAF0PPN8_SOLVR|nr:hypothetical protein MTR67_001040 [Solanum verrucosum]